MADNRAHVDIAFLFKLKIAHIITSRILTQLVPNNQYSRPRRAAVECTRCGRSVTRSCHGLEFGSKFFMFVCFCFPLLYDGVYAQLI